MKYTKPEIDIQVFEAEDILTASTFSDSALALQNSITAQPADAIIASWEDMTAE